MKNKGIFSPPVLWNGAWGLTCAVLVLLPLPVLAKIALLLPVMGLFYYLSRKSGVGIPQSSDQAQQKTDSSLPGRVLLIEEAPDDVEDLVVLSPEAEASRTDWVDFDGIPRDKQDSLSEVSPVAPELATDLQEILDKSPGLLEGLQLLGDPLTHEAFRDISDVKTSSDFIFENVSKAYDISDNLANTAKQAFELSENVQKGVKIVTGALSESLHNTKILFDQSKKITKILEIMSEISENIHVLSINASIVSARAGLSGKGFEVVAKEIRNLAKKTEISLKDIEDVIDELQNTIGSVIDKVQVANEETDHEKNALMSVAGALQGVILAVEIIRAVSSVAKDKAEEQSQTIQTALNRAQQEDSQSQLAQSLRETWSQLFEKIKIPLQSSEAGGES